MTQLGVVSGFSDGDFRPDGPVTRQEFAKMIVLAMRIPVSEADGITTGTGGTQGGKPLSNPESRITLAQVVTMMTRASGRTLTTPPTSYRSAWAFYSTASG